MGFNLSEVPVVGDIYKSVRGDPDAIKDAYDKQIAASQQAQAQLQQFLMGQKGQAQSIYAPLQHMFTSAYGTEGMQAPQTPKAPGGPLNGMFPGGR